MELKYMYNRNAVCPFCDYEDENALELGLEGDGDETTADCPSCGEQYLATLNLEVTFSTAKPKADVEAETEDRES